MDIRKLQRVIVDGLEDVKAQSIVVFNTEHLSSLFERVIIASGTSNRQTKALASAVREEVKKAGYPVPRLEGEANGEWIIIDCGAAVVHVMQPAIRDYYHLEELWGDRPVNMKLASAPRKLVKAEVVAAAPAPKRAAVAKKATPAAKRKAAPAKKASAPARKKAPAKKVAAPVTRMVGVKKTPAKKAPAKKVGRKA
jgi:ribosome-associated protein